MDQTAALQEPLGAAVSFPYPLRRPVILFVVFIAAAMAVLSFWRTPPQPSDKLARYGGRPLLAIGRVVGFPKGTPGGDSFLLSLQWVQPSGAAAFRSNERLSVFRKNPQIPFTWGDTVSLWGPLMPVEANRGTPRGVAGRLFVPEGRSVLLERASPLHPLRWAAGLRDRFHAAFNKYLPEPSAQLLAGVLLGDRPPARAPFAADFRRSGTFHLLVASGSNVGFSLGVWWVFSRWVLWWPRRWTIAVAPFVAFLYAFMAGGDPPVLRAAVMATVGSVGALLGRWDRLEHPLILSAGILLLWNPNSLFQAGFQMSYAATLAIAVVWGVGRNGEDPSRLVPRGARFFRWIGHGARDLFVTSLAAQLALAPLLLYYFGRFSWVGIGANMVAVPLSGLCLSLGAGLAFLDSCWPAAARLWAVPTRWGAEALAAWAHLCAKIPGAEWHLSINGEQTIALSVGVTLGFIALHFEKKRTAFLSVISVVTFCSVWALASPKPNFTFALSWTGGRSPSVQIQTEKDLTVFINGEPSPLDPLLVDGSQWTESHTRWEIVRPAGGDGFALRLDAGQTSALLNFGLTVRQQAEWVRRSPRSVNLLSWAGGKGGPPQKKLLKLLAPRWIVYQGPRIPISVRQSGAAVYRPRRESFHWRTTETSAGFYFPD